MPISITQSVITGGTCEPQVVLVRFKGKFTLKEVAAQLPALLLLTYTYSLQCISLKDGDCL